MNILVISEFWEKKLGGGEISGHAMVKALRKKGHYVEIISLDWNPKNMIKRKLLIDKKIYKKISEYQQCMLNYRNEDGLYNTYDIIHSLNGTALKGCVQAGKKFGIPVIITINQMWCVCPIAKMINHNNKICDGHCQPKKFIKCLWKHHKILGLLAFPILTIRICRDQWALKNCDCIIVISEYLKELLTSKFGNKVKEVMQIV